MALYEDPGLYIVEQSLHWTPEDLPCEGDEHMIA